MRTSGIHNRGIAVLLCACAIAAMAFPLAAAASEPITLEVMINSWPLDTIAAIERATRRFEQANPNIRVEFTRVSNWNTFTVRSAGGVPPDVITVSTNGIGNWGHIGLLLPMEEIIEQYGLKSKIMEALWPSVTHMLDGRIYGVPAIETGPRNGFVWDASRVDGAGIALDPNAVLTWDEFFGIAERLTVLDADGKVVKIGWDPENGQNSRSYTIAPMWDATSFDPVTGEPRLDSDQFIMALEEITENVFMRHPGWRGDTSAWYAIARDNGPAVDNLGIYGPGQIWLRKPDMRLYVTWPPHNGGKRTQQVLSWALGIPANAPHVAESAKLIEFLATDVELQVELFQKHGFLGGGIEALDEIIRWAQNNEAISWYLRSMWEADLIDPVPAHPFASQSISQFDQAKRKVFALQESARAALSEANRVLRETMAQQGFLKTAGL